MPGADEEAHSLIGDRRRNMLWVQLSRTFLMPDNWWDQAEIVGLISPKSCKHLTLRDMPNFADVIIGHDPNSIC
jgi:hypothetical protein